MPRTKMKVEPSWRERAKELVDAPKFGYGAAPETRFDADFFHEATGSWLEAAFQWQPETPELVSKEQFVHIVRVRENYMYPLLWVLVKQTKKLNPSIRNALGESEYLKYQAAEAFGQFLNALYNLSYEIFYYCEIEDGKPFMQYQSFSHLWYCIFEEIAQGTIDESIKDQGEFPAREALAENLTKIHKELKVYEVSEDFPCHMYNLFSVAASIARPNPRAKRKNKTSEKAFRESAWKPAIGAFKNYIVFLKGLDHPDRVLPDGVFVVWTQKDKNSEHFYSNLRGRKKHFPYKRAVHLI